jgi:hypothetical protein
VFLSEFIDPIVLPESEEIRKNALFPQI